MYRWASEFLKILSTLKMTATDQFHNFLWARKLSQKLFKFYNYIPHDIEMCRSLFQVFTEIKNGRFLHYLWSQKLKTHFMAGDAIGHQASCSNMAAKYFNFECSYFEEYH